MKMKFISKAISAVLLFSMLSAFVLTGCNKANEVVLSGTIESTQVDVNSEVSGKIVKLNMDKGASIKAGDILAVVDSALYEFNVKQQEAAVKLKQARLDELKAGSRAEQIAQAEAAVKAARAKLDELKAGARPEQIKQAEAGVQGASSAVDTANAAVDTADVNYNYALDKYNKAKALYDTNAVSENELIDANYKLNTAKQQLITAQKQSQSAQAQLESAKAQLELIINGTSAQAIEAAEASYEQAAAQLELLKKGSTSYAIKAAEAELEQSLSALSQAKLNIEKYNIKSSIDGTYLYRNVEIGDMVNAGTNIATVSNLNELWVGVYIPQKHLQAVTLNQEINLRSAGLPDKTIKGRIVYISSEAEYTPKNTETTEAKENTVFKLKIKILDNIESLKPGMTVDAFIPLH